MKLFIPNDTPSVLSILIRKQHESLIKDASNALLGVSL